MKSRTLILSIVLSAAAVLAVWLVSRNENALVEARVETPKPVSRIIPDYRPSVASTRRPSSDKPILKDEGDDDLPQAERSLKDRIEKALDDEDIKEALRCAEEARACPNPEVRQAMVDALGWFGKEALPELTPFLADADDDVRESACNEWSTAVSDIEDDREKVAAVEMAMGAVSDEDFLEDISTEYIGVDEKLAVESLMRVIADGRSEAGAAKARETYEFVTGDEWQGADEARRWLKEDYEPPSE